MSSIRDKDRNVSEVPEICGWLKVRHQAASRVVDKGRPKFEINKKQLVYLSSLNFSWTEIASLLLFRFIQIKILNISVQDEQS